MLFKKGHTAWCKGHHLTEEHKRRLSESLKGRVFSEETKRKMSESLRGNKHWVGKHHTAESKNKLSKANKGRHLPAEIIAKRIGRPPTRTSFKKGHASWLKGKHLSEEAKRKISQNKERSHKISIALTGKPKSEDHRRKLSEWHTGKHLSVATRKKISEASKGRVPWNKGGTSWNKGKKFPANENPNYGMRGKHQSEEARMKLSVTKMGKPNPFSDEHTVKISLALKGRTFSEETKRKMSVAMIERLKRGCFNKKPTTPEKKFIEICAKYNLPFKYVGDGQFWIENMNPDFVEVNGKKITVEILGDYWHSDAKPKGNFEKRKQRFAEYGWTCIGIWEHELKKLTEAEIVQKVCQWEETR